MLDICRRLMVNCMSSSEEVEKEDPIKLHKEGTALADAGKLEEASEKYLQASELYEKVKNFFDASYALFKAAECNYQLKDYDTAKKRFLKSADLAFKKGYDRFGVSALEYVLDCHKAMGEEDQADELKQKIKEVKEKLQNY
jgi:tetratricopeptide (TPR) repeat protein